jgi:hypothetical protein
MTLRNLARLGLGILLLTGLVAGGVHAEAENLTVVAASLAR